MTPEEFKKAMEEILKREADDGDREECHWDADHLMCDLLEELGYGDGIEVYRKLPKWYA
jgi:hypothetical protein